MKLKTSIFSCFILSFLSVSFPFFVKATTLEVGVIYVTDLHKYGIFVTTCNILSIVFFFLGFLLLILMWIYPFLERFKK